jgi:translation initiation factor IF-1
MVVYGFNPRAPIDLLPLPPSEIVNLDATQCSEFILKLHETTKLQIEKMNEKYRIVASKGRKEVKLEPGDLVWVHLRKDRFPDLRKSKLMPRAAGPFKVLEKINDNAYKLELPPEFGVSPTFNISDLKPYLGEQDELELRMTPIQEGEDDEDISPLHTMQGPITTARARQLDLQVHSNLVNYFSELTLGSMHVLLIRNNGEDQQGLKEEELGRPHQGGVHVQLDFDSTSDSRTLLHQN